MLQTLYPFLLVGFCVIAVLLLVMRWLTAVSGGHCKWNRLRNVHRNEEGAVQSLSFVLTLPLFILIMMGVVQTSQIMIAQIVVEYSAILTARSASVWLPAHLDGTDGRNRISELVYERSEDEGDIYRVETEAWAGEYSSPKVLRISMAAAQACVPIAPSRDTGFDRSATGNSAATSMVRAFEAIAPEAEAGGAISRRMRNKLTYALANTDVKIEVFHPQSRHEPLLGEIHEDVGELAERFSEREPIYIESYAEDEWSYYQQYEEDAREFQPNEIGWQDEITVTVKHNLALLPGPGRMFSRILSMREGSQYDGEVTNVSRTGETLYTWPLKAQATISNEGQKSVLRYEYNENGFRY
ncbi:MAG: TadE family protein [Pirellulales bacterium]